MSNRLLVLTGVLAAALLAATATLFPVIKSSAALGKQPAGFYLLPTNQLLRPWGEQTLIKGRPVDVAMDSRKHFLAVSNSRSLLLMDAVSGAQLADIPTRTTSYLGVAVRPGDREVWVTETTSRPGGDSIFIAKLSETGQPQGNERIDLPDRSVPCGIAFSADGKTAYVALSLKNSLAVIDAGQRKLLREIPVGNVPFAVVVSNRQGRAFVTNRGGRRAGAQDQIAFSSGQSIVSDRKTGSSTTGTVSVVDLKSGSVADAEVGLAPSQLTLSPDESLLAVANSHSDSISILDTKTLHRTDLKIPAYPADTLGSLPDALAFAPDGKRLYVACGGNNAIAVVSRNGTNWKVDGAVPTGWFPTAIAVDKDGALRIVNIKGVGNTANTRDNRGGYSTLSFEGSLLKIPTPLQAQVAAGSREVAAANSPKFESSGGIANLASLGIEHVFFIIKENRTYDQVLGDLPRANGDAKFVMFGRDITPNQHALAEKYVVLDNFYASGAISFDGHQWLMQTFVSDYVERAFASSPRGYAWNMSDSLTVSPLGMFWQSATKPLDVRIYGEFCLPAKWDPATQQAVDINVGQATTWTQYWNLYKEGKWQTAVGSKSGVPALQPYIDVRYPQNSTGLPDQIRADELLRELGEFEKTGKLPNLMVITMATDHTNGTRPGSPTPRAMVAEDDFALGRIVEGVSKSRFWPKSLILVVEDDAQAGLDHVDGHRTVALAIGPMVRRGAVDSNNYNHTSMVRTITEIFGIPQRTQFLANARAMHSVFTNERDLSAYAVLTPKVALDEMNPPLKALKGRQLWAAQQSLAMNWSKPDDINEDVLNRILWWDNRGYDKPYPVIGRR
jgi:YVTN family beta-propeller protein